jgi:hypothetical protein
MFRHHQKLDSKTKSVIDFPTKMLSQLEKIRESRYDQDIKSSASKSNDNVPDQEIISLKKPCSNKEESDAKPVDSKKAINNFIHNLAKQGKNKDNLFLSGQINRQMGPQLPSRLGTTQKDTNVPRLARSEFNFKPSSRKKDNGEMDEKSQKPKGVNILNPGRLS